MNEIKKSSIMDDFFILMKKFIYLNGIKKRFDRNFFRSAIFLKCHS